MGNLSAFHKTSVEILLANIPQNGDSALLSIRTPFLIWGKKILVNLYRNFALNP